MHAQEIIKMGFDPEKSMDEKIRTIFKDPIATILWCCIRSGHVTDQYFNNHILEASQLYRELKDPYSYDEFLKATFRLNSRFGRITVYETFMINQTEIDHEFWSDIFKAIRGKRCFKLENFVEKQETNVEEKM